MKPITIVKQLLKNSFTNIEAIECNGQFAFTDTYRLLILNDTLGYKIDTTKSSDIARVIERANNSTHIINIDIKKLQEYIKSLDPHKHDGCYPYNIKVTLDNEVIVNGKWLLKLLRVLNTDKIIAGDSWSSLVRINGDYGQFAITTTLSPKYFTGGND